MADNNKYRWIRCSECGELSGNGPTIDRHECNVCNTRHENWMSQVLYRRVIKRRRDEDKAHWEWRLLNYIERVLGGPKCNVGSSWNYWQEFGIRR
jgi:hypothetical protein